MLRETKLLHFYSNKNNRLREQGVISSRVPSLKQTAEWDSFKTLHYLAKTEIHLFYSVFGFQESLWWLKNTGEQCGFSSTSLRNTSEEKSVGPKIKMPFLPCDDHTQFRKKSMMWHCLESVISFLCCRLSPLSHREEKMSNTSTVFKTHLEKQFRNSQPHTVWKINHLFNLCLSQIQFDYSLNI